MNKRGGFGIPMVERVALRAGVDLCPARHCWVLEPSDNSGIRRPGLLVEWRPTDEDDWLGRVIYPAQFRAGEWMTLEEWLPPNALVARPVEG
jgi:hypothetical protein